MDHQVFLIVIRTSCKAKCSLFKLVIDADGLPWWSPSRVLVSICRVFSVELCVHACTALSGIYYSGPFR